MENKWKSVVVLILGLLIMPLAYSMPANIKSMHCETRSVLTPESRVALVIVDANDNESEISFTLNEERDGRKDCQMAKAALQSGKQKVCSCLMEYSLIATGFTLSPVTYTKLYCANTNAEGDIEVDGIDSYFLDNELKRCRNDMKDQLAVSAYESVERKMASLIRSEERTALGESTIQNVKRRTPASREELRKRQSTNIRIL